jgi:hypothetical protein
MAKISRSWDLPCDVLGAGHIRAVKEGTDIFIESDGLKVAKFRPGKWLILQPGWSVRDVSDGRIEIDRPNTTGHQLPSITE